MIKILHLFPDLLNLYGDYGNVTVLARALESMGARVSVCRCNDPVEADVSGADFIFCGAGTENRIAVAAEKLLPLTQSIRAAAERGVSMLFTGSAFELACREIVDGEKKIPGIGIFDASVRRTADRQTGDVLYTGDLPVGVVAGFINKSGFIRTEESPLFRPKFGPSSFEDGHQLDIGGEGLKKGSVIATYVTGPVLVRNPRLKQLIAEELFARCEKGTPMSYDDSFAQKGWEITVSELEKRMEQGK